MCSHKADKHMAYGELYHDNQSVFVSFDVKHIMLVAHIVRSRKVHFDIRKIFPFCPVCDGIPSFQSWLRVSMSFRTIEFNYYSLYYTATPVRMTSR